jgi:microcompartment protein CcmL/EutN
MDDALGALELISIAAGIQTCDEMMKVAPVNLIEAACICPGKYIIFVGGGVSEVDSSVSRGLEVGSESVVDHLFIPNLHRQIFPAISSASKVSALDALGIIETFSVASTVIAADRAAKAADVTLVEVRLAMGLAGKAFVTMTGDVASVNAAVEAGVQAVTPIGMLVKSVVIPSPHDDIAGIVF